MLHGRCGCIAGMYEVAGTIVVALATRHSPHQGEAVGPLGEQRQMFGNLDAVGARFDGFERSAIRRPRLGIEAVDLTRAPIQPNPNASARADDARVRPWRPR